MKRHVLLLRVMTYSKFEDAMLSEKEKDTRVHTK